MEELKILRNEIDQIDDEIIKLLEKRFNISLKIGEIKKTYNLPIQDANREKELITKNGNKIKNKEFLKSYLNILTSIIEESKKIQK